MRISSLAGSRSHRLPPVGPRKPTLGSVFLRFSNGCFGIARAVTAAAASARRLLELEPSFRIGLISSYSSNKERLAMLAEALRRAGLPE